QKRKRNQMIMMVAGLGCILAIIFFLLFGMDNSKKPAPAQAAKTEAMPIPGDVKQQDLWRTQQAADVQSNADRMSKLEQADKLRDQQSQQLNEKIDALTQQLRNSQSSNTNSTPSKTDSTPFPSGKTSKAIPSKDRQGLYGNKVLSDPFGKSNDPQQPSTSLNTPFGEQPKKPALTVINFDSLQSTANSNAATPNNAGSPNGQANAGQGYIPPGTFFRAVMLNGADAPAGGQGQSNPLPIALDVVDSANMPNKEKLNLKDCRIIASAWGDLSSERMMGRVETMSCIIGGQAVNLDIKGTIIGEDGKNGVRGRLISKQGIMIANAILAGGIGQIGQIYQQQATTTYTGAAGAVSVIGSGDVKNAAIGGGISGGAKTIADYYVQQASRLFPSIETDGGRVVEILVTKGATFPIHALDRHSVYENTKQHQVSVSDD
ncbi:MAG: hypothetical protein KGM99_19065, partial [Burkholderiales bacterium]|nr:hypothetical protein [Burkholderiales bacterium]